MDQRGPMAKPATAVRGAFFEVQLIILFPFLFDIFIVNFFVASNLSWKDQIVKNNLPIANRLSSPMGLFKICNLV